MAWGRPLAERGRPLLFNVGGLGGGRMTVRGGREEVVGISAIEVFLGPKSTDYK